MAQIVKLKRTAVSGRKPTIANLELGELAINTYDGRVFLEKSSSVESIQEFITTNTETPITGSVNIIGAITASNFKGDGSQLTNLPPGEITEKTTVTASYDNSDDITITHDFNSYNVIVSVYDSSRNLIIPSTLSLPTTNTARVTLSDTQSGFVVVAKGGHLISGSQVADNANQLNGQAGSYYLNWNNFNNVPSGIVSSSTQIDTLGFLKVKGDSVISGSSQVNANSITNFDANVLTYINGLGVVSGSTQINANTITNFDTNVKDKMNSDGVISGSSQLTSTFDSRYLNTNGDGVISGSSQLYTNTDDINEGSSNLYYTDARVKAKLTAEDVISGSAQITNLTTYKETVSGASTYQINHNLNEQYPIVQSWNTSTSQQEIPNSVTTNSANRVTVTFSTNFAGVIIVKK